MRQTSTADFRHVLVGGLALLLWSSPSLAGDAPAPPSAPRAQKQPTQQPPPASGGKPEFSGPSELPPGGTPLEDILLQKGAITKEEWLQIRVEQEIQRRHGQRFGAVDRCLRKIKRVRWFGYVHYSDVDHAGHAVHLADDHLGQLGSLAHLDQDVIAEADSILGKFGLAGKREDHARDLAQGERKLLDVASAQTRYGAFRAMWAMRTRDPAVEGEYLGGQFGYHVLDTQGPPMIHVTRSYRPEIVLFGREQRLEPPLVLDAGRSILVKATADDRVVVSRFEVGQPDQKRIVSTRVDDVIRTIVELGGTYPDVVQALQQAKNSRALAGRFAVDALPDQDRSYERKTESGTPSDAHYEVANPLPNLFSTKVGRMQRGL